MQKLTIALVTALMTVFAALPMRANPDHVEELLQSQYQGKTVTLRHFYVGEKLRFGSDGKLLHPADVGVWTVDGRIQIDSIRLNDGVVTILGRRILLVFDPETKKMRDLLTIDRKDKLAGSFYSPAGKEEWKKIAKEQKVEITIEFQPKAPTSDEVFSAMVAVFQAFGEPLADVVPIYWRIYLYGERSQTDGSPATNVPAYPSGGAAVSSPHATYSPDPEYSDIARRAKLQGTVLISLIVDKLGAVRDIRLVRPLGLGLDERSVEALQTWKFKPAEKDSQPVASMITIETKFQLY